MSGAYDRHGNWHPDPAWRQTEDWTEYEPEDIDFPERDEEYEAYLDAMEHDRLQMEVYDSRTDIGNENLPPF